MCPRGTPRALLGHAHPRSNERRDLAVCPASLWEERGAGLEHVHHPGPDNSLLLDARRADTLAEPDGVVEEDFVIAHVDQQRRQAVQVGEQR
jgi:hypothetical protein